MAAAALMIPTTVTIMILLLNPTGCDTSFKPLVNHDTLDAKKYLVGDQDIEAEFLMESHISRVLAESQGFETSGTSNATEPAVAECDRPPRYDSCLGEKRSTPPPENCGAYNREHPC